MYKVDKEKCLSCAGCTIICPNGMEMDEDSKAKVINQEEVEKAGGEDICPYGAIIKQDEKTS